MFFGNLEKKCCQGKTVGNWFLSVLILKKRKCSDRASRHQLRSAVKLHKITEAVFPRGQGRRQHPPDRQTHELWCGRDAQRVAIRPCFF